MKTPDLNQTKLKMAVTVGIVGTATLGSEIAAARLVAPWFGASTIVWANTIAIVLVALSAGYAIGGNLADKKPNTTFLAKIILLAAILLAAVPYIAIPFLTASASAFSDLSLSTFLGSLASVCLLVGLPLFLLGMVSPFALRLTMQAVDSAGKTAGRLSAIGTAGSLIGTFSAALLFIPWLGTRKTFLTFALLLVIPAIWLSTRKVFAALVAILIAVLLFSPNPEIKPGKGLIAEAETPYQYARVVARAGVNYLELNEGQAVHSSYQPNQWLPGGYWDSFTALTYRGSQQPKRVAVLGNAGGTVANALVHYDPKILVDGVELDPVVTDFGKRYFGMTNPRITPHTGDARPWLAKQTAQYDVIMVDAYRQPYVPFYLATVEFFELIKRHLTPGGVVMINVGHPAGSTTLTDSLAATMRAVFGKKFLFADPADATNTVLYATTAKFNPKLAPPALTKLSKTVAARTFRPATTGRVNTDNQAPIEWLIDLSFAKIATNS